VFTIAAPIRSPLRKPVFPDLVNRLNIEKTAKKPGNFLESARRGG
jgi:hypothetical protein